MQQSKIMCENEASMGHQLWSLLTWTFQLSLKHERRFWRSILPQPARHSTNTKGHIVRISDARGFDKMAAFDTMGMRAGCMCFVLSLLSACACRLSWLIQTTARQRSQLFFFLCITFKILPDNPLSTTPPASKSLVQLLILIWLHSAVFTHVV